MAEQFRIVPMAVLFAQDGRPVGFRTAGQEDTYFLTLNAEGTALVNPDGTEVPISGGSGGPPDDGSVTNIKFASVPTGTVKGRVAGGTGAVTDIPMVDFPVSTAQAAADAAVASTAASNLTSGISTHNAVLTAHGITAFMATVLDDTSGPAALTTLGAVDVASVALKANIASPALTGTPLAPTATAGTSTTQIATTAFATTADVLKLDKAFNGYSNVSVNTIPRLTKDHIAPLFDTGITLNRGWTMNQLKQWAHNIPHGLVGNGVTSDQSAFATYYGMLEDAVLNDTGSEARLLMPMAAPGGAFMLGANALHPAISVIGPGGRGSVCLRAIANMGTTGPDAVRAMLYYIARTRDKYDSSATWIPTLNGLWLSGNKNNQSGNFVYGIYAETAVNDPQFAVTFTASLVSATSATLTAPLEEGDGGYNFTFSDGTIKGVQVVGTACTWVGAVTATANAKYEGETIGFSSMHIYDCEVENFSGTGIFSSGKRRRLRMTNSRSLNHGLSGVPGARAHGIQFGGDAAVITGCGFGGCTGNSVLAQFAPEPALTNVNIWSPTASIRTDDQVGLFLDRCRGATVSGGNLEDIIRVVGGQERYEGVNISNIQFVPGNAIFAADGVLEGTATICAALRVEDHKIVHVTNCNWSISNDDFRYQYLVHATDDAFVKVDGMNTTDVGSNSYKTAMSFKDATSDVFWDHILVETGERQIDGSLIVASMKYGMFGERIAVCGASIDMHKFVAFNADGGQVSVTPTVVTFQANIADCEVHSGQIVSVGSSSQASSTLAERQVLGYGEMTRTGLNTWTVPRVDTNGGTFTINSGMFTVMTQEYTIMSRYLHYNNVTNFAKQISLVLAFGSNNVIDFYTNAWPYLQVRVNDYDAAEGTWDLGNTLLNVLNTMADSIAGGTPVATAVATAKASVVANSIPYLREMWTWLARRQKPVRVHDFPTPVTDPGGPAYSVGLTFTTAIQALMLEQDLVGAVRRTDTSALTIEAGTGHGDASLAVIGGNVHPSAKQCETEGDIDAEEDADIHPTRSTSRLICNPYERNSQNSTTEQYFEGGWGNVATTDTKVATSGLTGSSKFTGVVMNEVGDANVTGTDVTVALGVTLRRDKIGYDQTFSLVATTAAVHIFTMGFAGKASAYLIKDKLTVGRTYGGFCNFWIRVTDPALLKEISVAIVGNTNYGGGSTFGYYSSAIQTSRGSYFEDAIYKGWDFELQFPDWKYAVAAVDVGIQVQVRTQAVAGTVSGGFGRCDFSGR